MIETWPRRGQQWKDHRLVLDGVFWIAQTGLPWRNLHDHFGKWSLVYRQFGRWTLSGIWGVLLAALNDSGEGQDSLQIVDSPIVRAHQHAAGAPSKTAAESEGLDSSRGGYSTKILLRTNGLGLPVAAVMTGGEVSDIEGYDPVIAEPGPEPEVVLAYKGYDTDAILAGLIARDIAANISPKRNRKVQPIIDRRRAETARRSGANRTFSRVGLPFRYAYDDLPMHDTLARRRSTRFAR